jgi:hypothetical protein
LLGVAGEDNWRPLQQYRCCEMRKIDNRHQNIRDSRCVTLPARAQRDNGWLIARVNEADYAVDSRARAA